jgi:hypothetical protein
LCANVAVRVHQLIEDWHCANTPLSANTHQHVSPASHKGVLCRQVPLQVQQLMSTDNDHNKVELNAI